TKEPSALARNFQRARRKIHGRNPSSLTGEINCIGPDSTSDLQNFLFPPALELGKPRNMRLNKILAFFDLIKIVTRPDLFCGVANIARSAIPETLHFGDLSAV